MRPNSSIIKRCSNRTQDTKTLRHLLTVCNIRTNTVRCLPSALQAVRCFMSGAEVVRMWILFADIPRWVAAERPYSDGPSRIGGAPLWAVRQGARQRDNAADSPAAAARASVPADVRRLRTPVHATGRPHQPPDALAPAPASGQVPPPGGRVQLPRVRSAVSPAQLAATSPGDPTRQRAEVHVPGLLAPFQLSTICFPAPSHSSPGHHWYCCCQEINNGSRH